MKPLKKFFVYKCKLSLSLALLYLVELFINKLKTKFNNPFYRMIINKKKNSQLLLKKFPARAKPASKSFICWQEKATAATVRSLRAKIVIVGNSNELKIILFVLNYLTVLVYTIYQYHCRWLVVVIYLAASRLGK